MATVSINLDKRVAKKDGSFPLKLSLSIKGQSARISLNISLMQDEWDETTKKVIKRNDRLQLNTCISQILLKVQMLILNADNRLKGKTFKEIKYIVMSEILPTEKAEYKGIFIEWFEKAIDKHENGRTKALYEQTLKWIYKFEQRAEKLTFEDINRDWLERFFAFMAESSPSVNARNIHLRNIRSVFNDAIDNEVTTFYPFRRFKIRGEATKKRSLTVEQLRLLFNIDTHEQEQRHLDAFKLSFFLIGINMADLYNLETLTQDCRIEYKRAKTKRLYDIKVEPEALELIEKYKGKKKLLNLSDIYKQHYTCTTKVGQTLKRIIKTNGLNLPAISMYWARHTWATIAAELDIPKETISAALGHDIGSRVTSIYIDFNTKKIDEANRRVIDYVLYDKK